MCRNRFVGLVLMTGFAVFSGACTNSSEAPGSTEMAAADIEWPAYGSDKGGTKYSPLDADSA